jgi:hypothetical protein
MRYVGVSIIFWHRCFSPQHPRRTFAIPKRKRGRTHVSCVEFEVCYLQPYVCAAFVSELGMSTLAVGARGTKIPLAPIDVPFHQVSGNPLLSQNVSVSLTYKSVAFEKGRQYTNICLESASKYNAKLVMLKLIDLSALMLFLTSSPPMFPYLEFSRSLVHVVCGELKIHQKERPCPFGVCDHINHELQGSRRQGVRKCCYYHCMETLRSLENLHENDMCLVRHSKCYRG